MFKLSAMKTAPYILGCFVGAPTGCGGDCRDDDSHATRWVSGRNLREGKVTDKLEDYLDFVEFKSPQSSRRA